MDELLAPTKVRDSETADDNAANHGESSLTKPSAGGGIEAGLTTRSDYDLDTPIMEDQRGVRSNLPGYGDPTLHSVCSSERSSSKLWATLKSP